MEIQLRDEQRALRDELRAYFARMMTDELVRELATPEWQEGGGPEPLHRYFRWAIQIEHDLGSARHHLEKLGRRIAEHGLPAG